MRSLQLAPDPPIRSFAAAIYRVPSAGAVVSSPFFPPRDGHDFQRQVERSAVQLLGQLGDRDESLGEAVIVHLSRYLDSGIASSPMPAQLVIVTLGWDRSSRLPSQARPLGELHVTVHHLCVGVNAKHHGGPSSPAPRRCEPRASRRGLAEPRADQDQPTRPWTALVKPRRVAHREGGGSRSPPRGSGPPASGQPARPPPSRPMRASRTSSSITYCASTAPASTPSADLQCLVQDRHREHYDDRTGGEASKERVTHPKGAQQTVLTLSPLPGQAAPVQRQHAFDAR